MMHNSDEFHAEVKRRRVAYTDHTDCAICLNSFEGTDVVILDCGHLLHKNCTTRNAAVFDSNAEAYMRHYRCPLCRSELTDKDESILQLNPLVYLPINFFQAVIDNDVDGAKRTHRVLQQGNPNLVNQRLTVDHTPILFKPMLCYAITNATMTDVGMLQFLLENGATLNSSRHTLADSNVLEQQSTKHCAMQYACHHQPDNLLLISTLLAWGANANEHPRVQHNIAKNYKSCGPSPLYQLTVHATERLSRPTKIEEVIKLLLKRKADPNYCGYDKERRYDLNYVTLAPLHVACCQGAKWLAVLLIKYGAGANYTSLENETFGLTPLHFACGHKEVPSAMGFPSTQQSKKANMLRNNHMQLIELLINNKANVNDRIKTPVLNYAWGATPLHLAASELDWEIMAVLLRHGANPWMRNSLGSTPLHTVAQVMLTVEGMTGLHTRFGDRLDMNAGGTLHKALPCVRVLLAMSENENSDDPRADPANLYNYLTIRNDRKATAIIECCRDHTSHQRGMAKVYVMQAIIAAVQECSIQHVLAHPGSDGDNAFHWLARLGVKEPDPVPVAFHEKDSTLDNKRQKTSPQNGIIYTIVEMLHRLSGATKHVQHGGHILNNDGVAPIDFAKRCNFSLFAQNYDRFRAPPPGDWLYPKDCCPHQRHFQCFTVLECKECQGFAVKNVVVPNRSK